MMHNNDDYQRRNLDTKVTKLEAYLLGGETHIMAQS